MFLKPKVLLCFLFVVILLFSMGCEKKSSIISPEFENDYLQSSSDVISGEPIAPVDDPMDDVPPGCSNLNVKLLFTGSANSLSVQITGSGMVSSNPLRFNIYRYAGNSVYPSEPSTWHIVVPGDEVENSTMVWTVNPTNWTGTWTIRLKISEYHSTGWWSYHVREVTFNMDTIKGAIPTIDSLSLVSPNKVKVKFSGASGGDLYRNDMIVHNNISSGNTYYIDTVPLPNQTYSYQIKQDRAFGTNLDISFQSNIKTISTGRFTELYNISANAHSYYGKPPILIGGTTPDVFVNVGSINISGDLYVASNDYSNLTTKVYRSGSQYGTYELLDEFHGTDLYYSSDYTYETNYFSIENGTLSYSNGYWNHHPASGSEYWYKFQIIDHGYTYTTEPIYIYVPMPDGIQQL